MAKPSIRPVYEDFLPDSELKESFQHHFLHIHLPGFRRDQIRITFVNFTRTLNVYGERSIDSENNKWSRFNQSYPIPPNCEVERLQAKFSDGILTITMPKKVVSHPSPGKAQDKPTIPSKPEEPKPEKQAPEEFPPKPTTARMEEPKLEKAQDRIPEKYAPARVEESKPKKAQERSPPKYTRARIEELKSEKAQERIPQKYSPTTKVEEAKPEKAQERVPQKYTPTRVEEAKPEKAQEKTPQKYTAIGLKEARDKKTVEEASTLKLLETPHEEMGLKALIPTGSIKEPRPQGEKKPEKALLKTEEEKPTLKIAPPKPKDEKKPDKGQDEIKEKTTSSSSAIPRSNQTYDKKTSEPRKPEKIMFEEKEIRTSKVGPRTPKKDETRSKEDIIGMIGKGIKQVSDSASQVVTRISEGKWKEEEKPMIVNMGAAVLVIAALGAYMSYKFASSGRD
ncbi:inactive protein RESTRICTED TEV MOVEMENT 2-like [Senna tora]|uniref:Inactive protein RESTRICTED TEV MOVEMENT 2-like n=1 Tax=Senna tora TaxID=362788 RepID=A0A835CC65_9FABA|nr:inactive protein RESTRICTED TEV MOVEMENT 2-like [Senna tora]